MSKQKIECARCSLQIFRYPSQIKPQNYCGYRCSALGNTKVRDKKRREILGLIYKTNDCIEYHKMNNVDGYGIVAGIGAHRYVWQNMFGIVPDGTNVLHKCDNPPCINPNHLFLGIQNDNMKDMVKKGRSRKGKLYKIHCKHRHEFKPETTYIRPEGTRECLICRRFYMHKYYLQHPEKFK